MERYQVILAYDGSHFKGFQRQAEARTVQGVVEHALKELGWQGSSILAAGRTDTGTHASGQVIAFDLDWSHSEVDLRQALNNCLPRDVAASVVKRVNPAFHPRYDASWRKYRYHIYCQPVRQPLLDPYTWQVWPAASYDLLQATASMIVGTHDFGSFGTPSHAGGNTVRCVLESTWSRESSCWLYEIKAHAFLYHMVRRVVFIQVSIAQGKLELDFLSHALKAGQSFQPAEYAPGQSKKLVHGLAPAQGLILAEVAYPHEAVRIDEDNIELDKSTGSQLQPSR